MSFPVYTPFNVVCAVTVWGFVIALTLLPSIAVKSAVLAVDDGAALEPAVNGVPSVRA